MAKSSIVRCLALVMFMAFGSVAKADGLGFGILTSNDDMDFGLFVQIGDGFNMGNGGNNGGGHHHDHDDGHDHPGYPDDEIEIDYDQVQLTQQDSDQAVASCAKRNRYVYSIEKNGATFSLPGAVLEGKKRVSISSLGIIVTCTTVGRDQDMDFGNDFGGPAVLQPRYAAPGPGDGGQDAFFGDGFQPNGPDIAQPWPNQPMVHNPGVGGTTNGLPNVLPPVDQNFQFDTQALQ